MNLLPRLRRFNGKPVRRLIVSVPVETVKAVDALIQISIEFAPRRGIHFAFPPIVHSGNRSEFLRLAILEKLERDRLK